ncbi:MAG: hypothetical protein H0W83_03150 [Planctomycetes bacterium]|nr:hypothetical protein [Planctomycetota bacterium]
MPTKRTTTTGPIPERRRTHDGRTKRLRFSQLIRNKRAIAAVIAHTHWDRAWYHPFELFRLRLCQMVLRLLEILENDRNFTCFVFDGQTVVLEDFLELHPSERPRLERQIRAGRLVVGPFYVLPDLFLITPESLIRNGMIGQDLAESFGGSSRQGYIADSFGLNSQLPQIWAGLGLESVFFSRGISKEQQEKAGATFWWASPDGQSRILSVYQVEGYSNLVLWGVPLGAYPQDDPATRTLDFAKSAERTTELLGRYAQVGNRSALMYFGSGNDHHPVQSRLQDLLTYNAKQFPDVAFVQMSTDDMVDLIRQENPNLTTLSGEFNRPGSWSVLKGTLENRPYLKQQYDDAAAWLELFAEPLTLLSGRLEVRRRVVREIHHRGFAFNVGNNAAFPGESARPALRNAWKTLLRNAPHDDICGCSTDPTHEDAENRSKRVVEVASVLASDGASTLATSCTALDTPHVARIWLWNPLAHPRMAAWRRTMTVPANTTDLRLVDERGADVVATITTREVSPDYRRWHSLDFEKLPLGTIEVAVATTTDLPSLGYRNLFLVAGGSVAPPVRAVRRTADGMENESVSVNVHADGSFDVVDKRNGASYRGQNRLRDQGDAGDLYTSRLLEAGVIHADPSRCARTCIDDLPDRVSYSCAVELADVPLGLSSDNSARSDQRAALRIRFLITLFADSPVVHIHAAWTNQHREHRLTVEFPTGMATTVVETETPFDVVTREAPFTHEACRNFFTASSGSKRVSILSRAMHSAEARMGETGELVLGKCLLKANGSVFRFLEPHWAAPGGNCLRPLIQDYAFFPGAADDSWASIGRAAAEFCHQPLVEHYVDGLAGELPAVHTFIEAPEPFLLSAFKRAENGNSIILRFVNWSPRRARGRLTLSPLLAVRKAWRCDLRERRIEPVPVTRGKVSLTARSREIVTLELA